METHLLVFDFKALSIRVTSVTDKDTINTHIIDEEVYPGYLFLHLLTFRALLVCEELLSQLQEGVVKWTQSLKSIIF